MGVLVVDFIPGEISKLFSDTKNQVFFCTWLISGLKQWFIFRWAPG